MGDIIFGKYSVTEVHAGGPPPAYYMGRAAEPRSERGKSDLVWIGEAPLSERHPLASFQFENPARRTIRQDNPFGPISHFLGINKTVGLPRVLECCEVENSAFLVLEKNGHTPLRELGRLTESEVCKIGAQICRILAVVHQAGWVHNGVDADSFWIDSQGQVWLMRFDRVRPAGLYNPEYMLPVIEGFSAPEMYWLNPNLHLDGRIDVYSVGCVLFFLLTGRPLSSMPLSMRYGGLLGNYPDMLVSPALERILLRSLSINPRDRYGSMIELAGALIGLSLTVHPQVGSYTDVGRCRELNEDSLLVMNLQQCYESNPTNIGLYAVSDGMGGEAAGEVASRLTVRAVAEWVTERLMSPALQSLHGGRMLESTESCDVLLASESGTNTRATQLLTSAILHANSTVLDYAAMNPYSQGLGSTITVALIMGHILTVGQVGDSRCYVLSQGRFERITEDHSLVERMVRRGELTADEARLHPHKNIIYRSIGSREEIEIDIVTRRLKAQDVVLLCSDGLTGMLEDDEIQTILERNPDPWMAARELVIAANAVGGEDNITAIVIRFQ
ncbi:MAG: Stp1/IreP family PP2C-type Ser/Thr phosphatase [Blastocatellia bacterium]|nr:Stp1/IreP family PP2C-type Ser/Thr phosphatase [Blastocatellia bacterium]